MPWTFDHWWWWQKGFAAFGIAGQSSTGVSGRLQRDLKIDIYIYRRTFIIPGILLIHGPVLQNPHDRKLVGRTKACFGNHEADVGLPALKKRLERWHERPSSPRFFCGRKIFVCF